MIFRHIEGITADAVFSNCKQYRYKLTIQSDNSSGSETVCVIMQNPSIANAEIADKSVKFIERLIFTKSYREFSNVKKIIIVNQFALIKTKDFGGLESDIGEENNEYILNAIRESDIILIAWGRSNCFSARKETVNNMLAEHSDKTLLETETHPSRGRYNDFIKAYKLLPVN